MPSTEIKDKEGPAVEPVHGPTPVPDRQDVTSTGKPSMRDRIHEFFDLLELVNNRLPVLDHFLVKIALLGLLILGIWALFSKHP